MRTWLLTLVILISSLLLSGCSIPNFWKKTAGLQVLTPDVPASLFLDGQYLEKTPFIRKDLAPQSYTLKIVPDDANLAEYQTNITLNAGTLSVVTWKPGKRPETSGGVTFELEKLPGKETQLSLITIPDRALASIDGGSSDFAPLIVENITPGDHTFSVSMPSYESQEHKIQAIEGYRLNATVKLAQLDSSSSSGNRPTPTLSPFQTASGSGTAAATQSAGTRVGTGSAAVGTQVTINSTNFFQDGKEVLRVRDEASAEGHEVGIVEVGNSYPYLGEIKDGWYKIMFEGKAAWVSGSYVTLNE